MDFTTDFFVKSIPAIVYALRSYEYDVFSPLLRIVGLSEFFNNCSPFDRMESKMMSFTKTTTASQTGLCLVFLACFSLIGCSEKKSVAPPTGESQESTNSETPEAESDVTGN